MCRIFGAPQPFILDGPNQFKNMNTPPQQWPSLKELLHSSLLPVVVLHIIMSLKRANTYFVFNNISNTTTVKQMATTPTLISSSINNSPSPSPKNIAPTIASLKPHGRGPSTLFYVLLTPLPSHPHSYRRYSTQHQQLSNVHGPATPFHPNPAGKIRHSYYEKPW